MDKRVLLTVALCMGILFVWTKFFVPHDVPRPAETAPAATPANPGAPAAAAAARPETRKPGEPAVQAQATPAGAPSEKPTASAPSEKSDGSPAVQPKPPQQHAVVEHPGFYRADFTTWGAAPASWVLLPPHFKETVVEPDGKKELRQMNLVRTTGSSLPMTISFPLSGIDLAPDAAWTLVQNGNPEEPSFVWENDQVKIEKHFTLVASTYQLKLKITVENKGDKPLAERMQLGMAGHQDPNVKPGGMFSQRYAQTEGECHVGGKLKRADLQALLKAPVDETGSVRWIGIDEKYFLAALAQSPRADEQQRCWVSATADGLVSVNQLEAERKIAPKAKTEYDFVGFVGPKFLKDLDAVQVGGQDAGLGDAVNYGWTEAIARPMLAVLKAVHVVVPNWGLAIIALTILLKALTWWPTQKSMRSMREMAKLKPEVDKLKARYGEDKQKFNVAVMALYKERGINPLGGCLPMLIQMPIYIALYAMLGNSVELYRAPLFGWIQDLTSADPYYVLPILTGVLMFAQQKFSPQAPDQQQKMMMYMMPVMFTAFSIFLPAGLTIYILTNTLLTMLQQLILNRGDGPLGRLAVKPAKA